MTSSPKPKLKQRSARSSTRHKVIRGKFAKAYQRVFPALIAIVLLCTFVPGNEPEEDAPSTERMVNIPEPRGDPAIAERLTIGIKTFVCDPHGAGLVLEALRSIRLDYPTVRIILGNDGPLRLADALTVKNDPHTEELVLPPESGISAGRNAIVRNTTTEFLALLDDDHQFTSQTNLSMVLRGLEAGSFDIVGMRVKNLPGFEREERQGISINRLVGNVTKFVRREVTLCLWKEDNGPNVVEMRMPLRVDSLHSALIAKTGALRRHPWRQLLQLNEQMSFFLDARSARLKIGYLPSVVVNQTPRYASQCYLKARDREADFDHLLPYSQVFSWDTNCTDHFPQHVEEFMRSGIHKQLR